MACMKLLEEGYITPCIKTLKAFGRRVSGGKPQRSACSVGLFSIFANDLIDGNDCAASKFEGDVMLGGVAGPLEDKFRIKNNLDKLKQWSERTGQNSVRTSKLGVK